MYIRKKRLNTNKSIQYALAKLSGVGPFLARQICSQLGFPLSLSLSELSYEDRESLIQVIEEYHVVERELKAKVKASKKHLLAIKCYRGTVFATVYLQMGNEPIQTQKHRKS